MNADSSLIHNNPKPETSQMAFSQWMVEQIMVYPQYRLLLSIKGNKSLNKSPENYAMWKRHFLKVQYSTDAVFFWQNYRNGEHRNPWGVAGGCDWEVTEVGGQWV